MFIAGIDGGGTTAKLQLHDMNGIQICRKEFGPFNLTAVGRDSFISRLREIFSFCGNMSDCASLCIGCAGITKAETSELFRMELANAGFHGILKLCGDHEIALRGAMSGPGCILIAGTGSIAFGKNASGAAVRIGGYGHLIDDRGSGYAIGRDALALTVQTLDGCIPPNSLADAVLKFLNAKNSSDIVNYIYAQSSEKSIIAALAPVVLKICEAGELYGMEIIQKNSDDLVRMAETLIRRLSLDNPRIAFAGGLLNTKNIYSTLTADKISQFADVIQSEHDPLYGAVMLAEEELSRSKRFQI